MMWIRIRDSSHHRNSYRVDPGDIYFVRNVKKTPYGIYLNYKSKLNNLMADSTLDEVDLLGLDWFMCDRPIWKKDD